MADERHDAVRAQYERWVYPPPIDDLSRSPGRDFSDPAFLGRAYWPHRRPRADLRILVAGCGPNAAARFAYHHRGAAVVGVDLSEASLAHARRLKERHALENLALHRMRVEEVASLGQSFDLIDCSGVLHHLPDPAAGLKALAALLVPDGVLYLMLYGKYGRAGIYMMQELFRILGLQQSPQDVATVKAVLAALPADHPVRRRPGPDDLGFDAGIVDTFLHPIDRGFSVRDCLDLVEGAGLVLQGWLNRYGYDPASRIPQPELRARIASLPERAGWEALELIDARIASHNFYACRRDRDPAQYRIDFAGTGFMDMVAVPRPGWARSAAGSGLRLQSADGAALQLRERRAAVAALVDGRRTVRACFVEAGSTFESPQFVASFCRELFRELWIASYCDLVHPDAV
ncbi:MAG TPA: class I SAM-dependent methyltransferase [Burkholderiales bacterium]|nr:class I SAM-dependent methyltransferase [Burkholderiales bacterium]